jgi:hypothetical protein
VRTPESQAPVTAVTHAAPPPPAGGASLGAVLLGDDNLEEAGESLSLSLSRSLALSISLSLSRSLSLSLAVSLSLSLSLSLALAVSLSRSLSLSVCACVSACLHTLNLSLSPSVRLSVSVCLSLGLSAADFSPGLPAAPPRRNGARALRDLLSGTRLAQRYAAQRRDRMASVQLLTHAQRARDGEAGVAGLSVCVCVCVRRSGAHPQQTLCRTPRRQPWSA